MYTSGEIIICSFRYNVLRERLKNGLVVFIQATESRNASQDVVELFECVIYLQEVSDIICICFAGMIFICIANIFEQYFIRLFIVLANDIYCIKWIGMHKTDRVLANVFTM